MLIAIGAIASKFDSGRPGACRQRQGSRSVKRAVNVAFLERSKRQLLARPGQIQRLD
jgi:hypothetical protein